MDSGDTAPAECIARGRTERTSKQRYGPPHTWQEQPPAEQSFTIDAAGPAYASASPRAGPRRPGYANPTLACIRLAARFPHGARAAALVALALATAGVFNAFNPRGIRWTLPPDGRVGIPRAFEGRLPEISASEAQHLFKTGSAIFVDGRDEKDYRAGHVPGALNLPMRRWREMEAEAKHTLPRESRLVLYCYGGKCGLSTRMGKRLLEIGYQRPMVLRHGWEEWTKAGYRVERTPASRGSSN